MTYPVTTPFGQVAGYPLNNGFHNGIDYGYPMGTPVVVNGVTIGLSNNTGASTGPHLHVGKYINGQVQDPGVGNGFKFNSAVVYDTGSDATNGNFVRITGDGALWNYLHLEKILVTKGQILKGESMNATLDECRILALTVLGRDGRQGRPNAINGGSDADLNANHVGQPLDSVVWDMWNSAEGHSYREKTLPEAFQGGVTKETALDYIKSNLK